MEEGELKQIVTVTIGPITNSAWKNNNLELLEITVRALYDSQRRRDRVWTPPIPLSPKINRATRQEKNEHK